MSKEESNGEAGTQEAATSDAPPKDPNAEIYENRGPKKIIRVVTVMAYLFSVSFVGILLSTYYIFLWEPPNPRPIERGRLLAGPQMQLLIAAAPSADLKEEDSDFLLKSELNRTYKPLLGRSMAQSAYEPRDEKQGRLSAMLPKLRHSLVEAQKRRILSQKAAISGGSNNSSIRVENSTSEYDELRRNISKKKNQSDNIYLSPEFTNSTNTLEVEGTFSISGSATLPETETKRSHFDGESITNVNLTSIIDRGKETRNYQRKLDDTERYPVRGSSNARRNDNVASDSDRRVFEDNVSSKVIRGSPKFDISNDTKELMKNETNDRQSLNKDRENNPSDMHTIATSKQYVEGRASLLSSINAGFNNRQEDYSGNNEVSSSNQTERIARDKVSIASLSRDSGFTDGDPGLHRPPDDSTVVKSRPYATRNVEETQIERVAARSTTIDNKQLKETENSSTTQQKSFWEVWTEAEDVEETSAELTSILTTRNYRNNFTSAANDDDESVT